MAPSPRRLPGELIFTLLLAVGSLFLLWQAYGISKFESLTSAGAFPMVTTVVMVLAALKVFWKTRRTPAAEPLPGDSPGQQFVRALTPLALVTFTAAIVVYMLLLELLGFVVSSYLFLLCSMALLGSRRWVLNAVVAAVCLGAVYVVFQTIFSVVLPKGTWIAGWLQ